MIIYDRGKVQQKIDCSFADAIYSKYQAKRWGVNSCSKSDIEHIEDLDRIKQVYDYYNRTWPHNYSQGDVLQLNTECCDCNITLIIEKINRL